MKKKMFWQGMLVVLLASFPCIASAAMINWTNLAGGNWSVAANWYPNQVPGTVDTALITNVGTYTVTMDVGTTLAGLVIGATAGTSGQTLSANGQSLTLNGNITVNSQGTFNFTNGSFGGAITLSGSVNCASDTINSSGSLTVQSNGVLNLMNNGFVYGPLTNNGVVNWLGGNIWIGNASGYSGVIWNEAGARWSIQCNMSMNGQNGSPIFNNAGALTKTNLAGTTTISVNFNNTGMVLAQSGTINFSGGAILNGGNYLTGTGAAITYVGTVSITGPITNLVAANVTINGLSNLVSTASLANCTVSSPEAIVGTVNWSGGTINSNGSLTVQNRGMLNWTGAGYVYGTLTNYGVVNWLSGNIYLYGAPNYPGLVWNQAGAQWNIQCNLSIINSSGSPVFNNAGTLTKTNLVGTTLIGVPFNNSGLVLAQSGTLTFSSGGILGGTFQSSGGAAIAFTGGSFNWTSATLFAGPGSVQIAGGSLAAIGVNTNTLWASGVTVSGLSNLLGTVTFTNCTINDTEAMVSTINWMGGTINSGGSLTVQSNGVLNWMGNSDGSLTVQSNGVLNWIGNGGIYGPLTNNGVVNWQGGNILMDNASGYSGGIWNQAGAQWNVQCNLSLINSSGSPVFNNAGMVTKQSATSTTSFGVPFNNSGVVWAQSGIVDFTSGGVLGGTFQSASGAAIDFTAGNFSWIGTTLFEGPGSVQITGGNLAVMGANTNTLWASGVAVSGLNNLLGTVSFTNCTINDAEAVVSTVNWLGGTINSGGSLLIQSNGVLNLAGGPSGTTYFYGPLINNGVVNWQGGSLWMYGPATYSGLIWNQAGAQWNIQCDQTLSAKSGSPVFNNAGLFTKQSAASTTSIGVPFNNTGTVLAQSGTIQMQGGGVLGGTFQSTAGAAIYFSGGNLSLVGIPSFQGPGLVQITGGTVAITGTITNLSASGVTISGLGNLVGTASLVNCAINDPETIVGTINWSGGTINSGASLTVQSNGVLNLINGFAVNGPLINNGVVNWLGGGISIYGGIDDAGAIWNQAQWYIQCDQGITNDYSAGAAAFNNAGTVTKMTSTGTNLVGVTFNNSGEVLVQSGAIQFTDGCNLEGAFQAATGAAIYFSSGNFTLAGTPPFYGPGAVQITGGTLVIAGPITNLTVSGVAISGLRNLAGTANLANCKINDAETIAGTVNWSGGTINFGGSLTVPSNAVLNVAGGSGGITYLYGPLTNNGVVNWQGGNIGMYNASGYSAMIWNQAGADWSIQCDQTLYDESGSPVFSNAGSVTKTGTSGTTTVNVTFNNSGLVQALSGKLNFAGGAFLNGGTYLAPAGSAISYSGNLAITGLTTNLVASGVTITGLSNLAGTAILTNCTINDAESIAGTINWVGGTINGGASLTVQSGGMLNLIASTSVYGLVTNNGVVNWQGGSIWLYDLWGNAGEIWNQAGSQWNIQCDQSIYNGSGAPFFDNVGTVTKMITTGTNALNVTFNNRGLMQIQSGTISLNENSGLPLGGTLNFSISSPASYGAVYIAGSAVLGNATASVTFSTNYSPATGNSFPVASFGSLGSLFGALNLSPAAAWLASYGSNAFTASIINVRPVFEVVTNPSVQASQTLVLNTSAFDPDVTNGSQKLTYQLAEGPAGAALATNGIFTWTPTPSQSPSTNVVMVIVADNGTPALSATNTFTVFVQEANVAEVNMAPVFFVLSTQLVDELTLLTVTNTATEFNSDSTVDYVLVDPPAGASIDPSGVITWTPAQAESPSTNIFVTIATSSNPYDPANPQLTSTNVFTVIVQEVNVAPVLSPQTNAAVNEFNVLTVTNTASEANLHSTVGYTLVNAPDGASINTNGIITWFPAQVQSPSTNVFTTITTSSNPYDPVNPQLTSTNAFTVIVKEVNVVPVLSAQTTVTVNELTLLTVTNTASETNHHSVVSYALVNPPNGAVISANGVITWTPSAAQSPGTNVLTTIATSSNPYDLVNPSLTVTNTVTVIVEEVNLAPVLPAIAAQTVQAMNTLTVSATATATNAHATITYRLVNAPAGMIISTGGVITWTPALSQAPTSNTVLVIATSTDRLDPINPVLSQTNSFTVLAQPFILLAPAMLSNGAFTFSFNTITNVNYTIEFSSNLTVWTKVLSYVGDGSTFIVADPNAGANAMGFYRVQPQ